MWDKIFPTEAAMVSVICWTVLNCIYFLFFSCNPWQLLKDCLNAAPFSVGLGTLRGWTCSAMSWPLGSGIFIPCFVSSVVCFAGLMLASVEVIGWCIAVTSKEGGVSEDARGSVAEVIGLVAVKVLLIIGLNSGCGWVDSTAIVVMFAGSNGVLSKDTNGWRLKTFVSRVLLVDNADSCIFNAGKVTLFVVEAIGLVSIKMCLDIAFGFGFGYGQVDSTGLVVTFAGGKLFH